MESVRAITTTRVHRAGAAVSACCRLRSTRSVAACRRVIHQGFWPASIAWSIAPRPAPYIKCPTREGKVPATASALQFGTVPTSMGNSVSDPTTHHMNPLRCAQSQRRAKIVGLVYE